MFRPEIKMKEQIKIWLGITTMQEQVAINRENLEEVQRVIDKLEKDNYHLQMVMRQFEKDIEEIMLTLKLPYDKRLAQIKQGLDTLAQFANELQRDAEGWNK